MNFSPELLPNRITNVEIKNKKMNNEISARTTDDSSRNIDGNSVSPACIKPNVVRSCIQEENLYTPNCIRTFTGIYMNVFEPTLEMICIDDIAHALSMQCRFGGHLPEFYSVAQHCVLTSENIGKNFKLPALLHDASEAYLLDIPKPIKNKLTNYENIENTLMKLIARKFKFAYPLYPEVHGIDKFMLEWEWSSIMLMEERFHKIECWSAAYAKEQFLKTFYKLRSVTA